jgi:hypothetical protein
VVLPRAGLLHDVISQSRTARSYMVLFGRNWTTLVIHWLLIASRVKMQEFTANHKLT